MKMWFIESHPSTSSAVIEGASAIIASGSLAHYDRQITAPTVVLHGKADKLQRPFGGRVVARTIPGARLRLFDGMGHDLPEELWDDVIGELTTTFTEA